jgi:hypothetical protein
MMSFRRTMDAISIRMTEDSNDRQEPIRFIQYRILDEPFDGLSSFDAAENIGSGRGLLTRGRQHDPL